MGSNANNSPRRNRKGEGIAPSLAPYRAHCGALLGASYLGGYMTEYWNLPCAAADLTSYRYRGRYGWIMIGAHDTADALREAARSTSDAITADRLERWNGDHYGAAQ